jgi:hypothetical protein
VSLTRGIIILAVHIRFAEVGIIIFFPEPPAHTTKAINGRSKVGWEESSNLSAQTRCKLAAPAGSCNSNM